MKTTLFALTLAALGVAAAPVPDRLTDRDVKALAEHINTAFDAFEDALPGSFKDGVIRNETGEVKVDKYLDDFDRSIDDLKDRLKPDYSASAEARSLLARATAIDDYVRKQAPGMKGESEWNRLKADLQALAAAYGTDFPLAVGAPVRRIGDKELAAEIDVIAKSADGVKKSLQSEIAKDPTINAAARKSMVDEADMLVKNAKALKSRVEDGLPSSAEADRLLSQASKIQAVLDAHQVPGTRQTWTGIVSRLQTVAGAFRLPWTGQ